ncbi:MAG TPA: NUDIX domain-containing protein [Solirubrobacteraceae bacterium]
MLGEGADGAAMHVVAAAIVQERRLLLVSKRAAPDVFYLPGGKPQEDERLVDCLRRELAEELAVTVRAVTALADFRAVAALEGVPMRMTVYATTISGTPRPQAEIAALRWWPAPRRIDLAPAVADFVVPLLRRRGAFLGLPVA